ncbi:MAG TPA: hypothetical protein PJ982_16115, partial [Lacipirellulaceae bacterium]|nr:hypothetical protein [Lacipirellulaceae bacterium]
LQRLRECFESTGDPQRCVDAPPNDLVHRTCCLVESACSHGTPVGHLAGMTAEASPRVSRNRWSAADLVVAGAVILTLGMLTLPALRESRDAARRLVCHDNLRALGTALFDYQQAHAGLLPTIDPGQHAGEYIIKLAERGGVSRADLSQWRTCPLSMYAEAIAAGRLPRHVPSRAELAAVDHRMRSIYFNWSGGSYAYDLSFYDEHGNYRRIRFTGDGYRPMLADAPQISPRGVRSGSHGSCGQYVLYQNLSAPFRANCDLAASVDNIFLNSSGEHAAGRGPHDVVLGKSGWGPDGRVVPLTPAGAR